MPIFIACVEKFCKNFVLESVDGLSESVFVSIESGFGHRFRPSRNHMLGRLLKANFRFRIEVRMLFLLLLPPLDDFGPSCPLVRTAPYSVGCTQPPSPS
jgi:hypothetical protein